MNKKYILVYGAVQTDAAHHEVDWEVSELTDRAGEADTSLVSEFTTCSSNNSVFKWSKTFRNSKNFHFFRSRIIAACLIGS